MQDAMSDATLPLTVESPANGSYVIAPLGEIDAHTAPCLRKSIHAVLDQPGLDHLIVDLTGATFLDSSALGVLVGALKRMRERDGRFDVVVPSSPIRRIFEITALDQVLALHETRESALSATPGYQPS